MYSVETFIRFLSGVGLIGANAFFVATEFAMTRVPQFDREEFQGDPGLERAWEMTNELEIYLTACQVGITITSILLGVVFEPAVSAIIQALFASIPVSGLGSHAVSVTVSVVLIQFIHTVWGEQSPTYLGVERPKPVAKYCAPILYWWGTFMYPAIYLGDHVAKATLRPFGIEIERSWKEDDSKVTSRAELRRQVGSLLNKGEIPNEEREEIINTLDLAKTPTADIMVPRDEIIALSTEMSPEQNYERMCKTHHARFPLVGETLDDFAGIVYVPGLLPDIDALRKGEMTYSDVAVEPLTVPSDLPVNNLVDRLQEEHQELALVEEGGDIVGLVTATDAFEAIIGEMDDPFDEYEDT